MTDHDMLAEQFEAHRDHLRGVAIRMLGSTGEADDAVQEAWLRLSRTDAAAVDNLGGWLTTVVARISLDMLRSRTAKREVPDSPSLEAGPSGAVSAATSPADAALIADSVGLALLVVLDTLAPAERLAFVLHDMFAVPFDDIGPIVGRSPAAARQLASRARRRVQSDPAVPDPAGGAQREIVGAFLDAAHHGDFARLLMLLDPDVVLRADAVAIRASAARRDVGAPELAPTVRGVDAVARIFAGGAKAARLTLVDSQAGAMVAIAGRPVAVFAFTVKDGLVTGIDLISDPETLEGLELERVRR